MQTAKDIVEVVELRVLEPFRLYVRFSDDEEKEVDLSHLTVRPPPVFEALLNPEEFQCVDINVVGGISWRCGADLSANYLKNVPN